MSMTSVTARFNNSKIFLLYFYKSQKSKNFSRGTAYSCRTNVFIKFHHLMKKIDTAED